MKKTKTLAPIALASVVTQRSPAEERAEELTSAIKSELRSVAQSFWRVGRGLHEIQASSLFRVLGYETFADYVTDRLSFEASQAYKLVRVASSYFQEDAEALGLERAAALIPYAKLLNTDPGLLVRENVRIGDRPVVVASKRDIQKAAADVRVELEKRHARAPAVREQKRAEKAIHQGLRVALKGAALPAPISVRFDPRNGEVIVRLPRKPLASRFPT